MSIQQRFLVIGILSIVTSATLDARRTTSCDYYNQLEFDDVASVTVLSAIVFDGRSVRSDSGRDVVEFRVGQVYKGAELFPDWPEQSSRSAVAHVAVRMSSTECASSLRRRRRRRYLVFLNGSRADSVDDQRQAVYWSTAGPVRFSKRSVKIVKRHSCHNCASAPRSARMTPSAVYGRFGHPLEMSCRASRHTKPPPRVTWFKNGIAVVISGRLQVDSTRLGAMLVIHEARLDDAGAYSCHVSNVIGSADSTATHVTVAEPVPASKPHSRLCDVQYYCLNQGTCYVLTRINRTYCECIHPYTGPRCQDVRLDESMSSASVVENPLVLGGLLLSCFVIMMLLIAIAYFVIRHYNEFKRHQTQSRPSVIASHVNGSLTKSRPGYQLNSSSTQTGKLGVSVGRALPHVVVTSPSPEDRRPEPTVMRHVPRSPPAGSPGRNRVRLSAISTTPNSDTPDTANVLDGDRERQRSAWDGRSPAVVDRVGNGCAAGGTDSGNFDVQRRHEDEQVQALLRELGVDTASVST